MARQPQARWWEIRRAANLKPVSYRCPLCHGHLPALSEHLLLLPEGSSAGRRHAHTDCVLAARKSGGLPTRDEWRATRASPPARRTWRRWLGGLTGRRPPAARGRGRDG